MVERAAGVGGAEWEGEWEGAGGGEDGEEDEEGRIFGWVRVFHVDVRQSKESKELLAALLAGFRDVFMLGLPCTSNRRELRSYSTLRAIFSDPVAPETHTGVSDT